VLVKSYELCCESGAAPSFEKFYGHTASKGGIWRWSPSGGWGMGVEPKWGWGLEAEPAVESRGKAFSTLLLQLKQFLKQIILNPNVNHSLGQILSKPI